MKEGGLAPLLYVFSVQLGIRLFRGRFQVEMRSIWGPFGVVTGCCRSRDRFRNHGIAPNAAILYDSAVFGCIMHTAILYVQRERACAIC